MFNDSEAWKLQAAEKHRVVRSMTDIYFAYGDKEIEYLKRKDRKLAAVIERLGHIYRPCDTELFRR